MFLARSLLRPKNILFFFPVFFVLTKVVASAYITWRMMKKMENQGNSPRPKRPRTKKSSRVYFRDIYGHENIKKDLTQIVDYFKNPLSFSKLGAKLRKGVLLYGPSGTGKTMLAKALANEAGIKFLYRSASEFVEMYVGVGPRRIRDLFLEAKMNSPCIVFIDEIDALGSRSVSKDEFGRSNEERNATVNQILVEIDGFEESDRVVVIAATNREKFLDFALVRSGRFDLKFRVNLPDAEERAGIYALKLERARWQGSVNNIEEVAGLSEGFSGADIEAAVNEAIYASLGKEKGFVDGEDLMEGFTKIYGNLIQVHNRVV